MSIGLDYTQRIAPSALKAAGVTLVCRYIAPQDWKVIHQAEYDELLRNGFKLYLNWESSARDWGDGAAGGKEDGVRAVRMAKALGYPAGSIIIGSADYDATDMNVIRAYGSAFKAAIEAGGYKAGVYGPWDVLSVCQNLGFAFYWQTMSRAFSGWRNANLHPATNLWQKGYKTVGGVQADWNQIIRLPDEGTSQGELDVELTDGIVVPNYDHDPALPDNQPMTVAVALGVAAQRSWQALQAAKRVEEDLAELKTAVADLNVSVPELDYDRLSDLVVQKLGHLKFVAEPEA